VKFLYHFSRIVFGGWFLYSGLAHFLIPGWQPLGSHQPAVDFTLVLMASGLFTWVKIIEVALGATMLANRLMPLTVIALVPLNVVICYWNFVLDPGAVEYAFGILTIIFNAVLAWMWRGYFWQLFVWQGAPDFSLDPGWRGAVLTDGADAPGGNNRR
jgi:hypothetical protein